MVYKQKLIFDPADAADSDNIGSYLLDSAGTALTSTLVGSDQALDINLVQSVALTVTATDLDIRDLTHVSDSVKVGDGTDLLAVNADGSINSVVTATDLDIRDLSASQDNVAISDGTDTLAINADGSINVNLSDDNVADDAADSGNPIKIGGHAYSTASVLDAADADDRVNLATDLYRRVLVSDIMGVALEHSVVTVGATAVTLPASALAGRKKVTVQNVSANPIWVGKSSVTTSGATRGLKLEKGAEASFNLSAGVVLYGIAAGAGNDVLVFEEA